MILLYNFLIFYKNNILEKKIIYNILPINKKIKYNKIINKNKFFYNIFYINNYISRFKKNNLNNNIYTNNFNNKSSITDKLFKINKLFEGSYLKVQTNLKFYKYISLLKCIKYNINFNFKKLYAINNIKLLYLQSNINMCIYKLSLIMYPLTFNSSKINNYIYYIYYYLYKRSKNSYKSSIISLFYYNIGLLSSLLSIYFENTIKVLYSNIVFIVTRLSLYIYIIKSLYSPFIAGSIVSIKLLNIINNILFLHNLDYCKYRPYLIGLTKYISISTGVLSKLGFQNVLKTIKDLIIEDKVDWKVDSKSNIITSDFIPIGSGWYRYFINF
uniref:DNA-directed RNA polymerase beta subunit C-terminal domain protein n=1 Tax=Babesia duncani TaxID=323732 RepID=A0A385GNK1_9APIC|nr:DNA-directed RNA polymerase beta subunit C-terminal domain protein [Babesia duncani]